MAEPTPDHDPSRTELDPRDLAIQLRYLLLSLQLSGVTEILRPAPPCPAPSEPGGEPKPLDTAAPDSESLLQAVRTELGDCRRCRLHEGRRRLVFGDGSGAARLVFVGEGPGEEEDRQGRPFVGKAGKLLDQMIRAMGLERSQVYICNVVKCRPPGNRTPQDDEAAVCSPFLFRQLEAIRPRVICALGACAAQTLTQERAPVGRLRRRVHAWRGIPLVVTYHPAYLLRTPSQKAAAWDDLQRVMELLT